MILPVIGSKKGLNEDSNPDLCDAGVLLYLLSYQVNSEDNGEDPIRFNPPLKYIKFMY